MTKNIPAMRRHQAKDSRSATKSKQDKYEENLTQEHYSESLNTKDKENILKTVQGKKMCTFKSTIKR